MPLLSTAEIAAMRSEQSGSMPDTVVIHRYTSASDGMGGNAETWAAVGTVTGRVGVSGGGDENITAERLTATDRWVITVPTGSTVYERDRLVVAGRTFEVSFVARREAWETALRCYGAEVAG